MKTIQVSVATDGYYVDQVVIHTESDIKFSDDLDRANVDYIESLLPEKYRGRGNMIIAINPIHEFILVGGEVVTD